jgi:LysR family glycine cleavage system transcriptional activator
MLSQIPFTALRAFDQVAEHLSFTRAAQALHVTQSAVSQQVAQLEERIGKRLVERSGRTLRLTAHGQTLAAACQQSFGLLEAVVRRIAGGSDAKSVYIKVPPTFAMKWLMPRLTRFQVQHSQIELHVTTSIQPTDFDTENVDVSMQRGVDPPRELHAIPVLEERGMVVCSPKLWGKRRAELSALQGMTQLISVNRRDDWPLWLNQAGGGELRAERRLEFGFGLLAYQAAIEGLGVAIAQPEFVEEELRTGRLIAPFRNVISTGNTYFIVCPASRRRAPAVARFLSWVEAELRLQ